MALFFTASFLWHMLLYGGMVQVSSDELSNMLGLMDRSSGDCWRNMTCTGAASPQKINCCCQCFLIKLPIKLDDVLCGVGSNSPVLTHYTHDASLSETLYIGWWEAWLSLDLQHYMVHVPPHVQVGVQCQLCLFKCGIFRLHWLVWLHLKRYPLSSHIKPFIGYKEFCCKYLKEGTLYLLNISPHISS